MNDINYRNIEILNSSINVIYTNKSEEKKILFL